MFDSDVPIMRVLTTKMQRIDLERKKKWSQDLHEQSGRLIYISNWNML